MPNDVSFGNIQFKEGSCTGQRTGMLLRLQPTHPEWPTWYNIIGDALNKVDLPPATGDSAIMYGGDITEISQYSIGTASYPIPWMYKAQAVEQTFTTVYQEFRTASNGDHGVKKDGEGWHDVNHNDDTDITGWPEFGG